MAIYRDTQVIRATLKKIAVVILGEDAEAPPMAWREVQLVIPDEPRIFVSTSKSPDDIGLDRHYLLAPWYPSRNVPIRLRPGQWLAAACEVGIAECSLIVEHHMPDELMLQALQKAASPTQEG